LEKNLAT